MNKKEVLDLTKKIVSVSSEPAENSKVIEYAGELIKAGADMYHCDVMDGVAVRKVTYDYRMVKILRLKYPDFPLDVHLMTRDTISSISKYAKLKPYSISVQYEYFNYEKELIRCLKTIKRKKVKAGIAIAPQTPISYIMPYFKYIDMILIMSVIPGAGGQKFIPETLNKIREAKDLKNRFKKDMLISVDGGINFENAETVFETGADIIVSGSTVYNCFSRKYAIDSLRTSEPIVK